MTAGERQPLTAWDHAERIRFALLKLQGYLGAGVLKWSRDGLDSLAVLLAQKEAAEAALAAARRSHLGDAQIANAMVNHFPVEIRCDHDAKQDKVFCDCGVVDLGWHPSVRRAKEAWAAHVIAVVKDARLTVDAALAGSSPAAEAETSCPICGHEWRRHDPEDGCCDAHSEERIGVCECGRDMAFMHRKIAALSVAALSVRAASGVSDTREGGRSGDVQEGATADAVAVVEHRIEIVQKFWADGHTAECSCGWRSEEMASRAAAMTKGIAHASEGEA